MEKQKNGMKKNDFSKMSHESHTHDVGASGTDDCFQSGKFTFEPDLKHMEKTVA